MNIPRNIVIVTPVFNDWASFQQLARELVKASASGGWSVTAIIAVNDGSSDACPQLDLPQGIPVSLVNLTNNMGHQRAISIGLSYVEDNMTGIDMVVVMDSDGEDRPGDIASLLEQAQARDFSSIIFAKRKKRSEGLIFKLFYRLYKMIFIMLTRQRLDFGNFSCIPGSLLPKVIALPESWNHYSGGIIKSKIPYDSVGTNRGKRYSGSSKMNFQNLVLHGMSSISIYLDVVSVRMLFASFTVAFLAVSGLLVILYLALFTAVPIPGWSSIAGLLLINILAIVILTTFLILLFQLNQKAIVKFPPKSFYKDFILSVEQL